MDRILPQEAVEGEIALVIDYLPGESKALDVLGGAMALIAALDALDAALLSSISTELEPVSILNDVQHSSLKILLERVLKSLPDDHLGNLDWKKWIGALLVKGKHALLQRLEADAPAIEAELRALEPDYRAAPTLIGYDPPKVKSVQQALRGVSRARATLGPQKVLVQTELGDIVLGSGPGEEAEATSGEVVTVLTNRGREFLKVRYPDMLGQAQWTVMRNGRTTRVELLHKGWLDAYHARAFTILPGDSLDCSFEESIGYDAQQNEVERKLSIVEVHGVVSPPAQSRLPL
ncbi:MAG: hypothetical protein JNL87_12990 [Burkholderiaceae bacterium]|nr:hypothetical protein [Burkholderiaceae bacterium]